jgi:hypothetical protein
MAIDRAMQATAGDEDCARGTASRAAAMSPHRLGRGVQHITTFDGRTLTVEAFFEPVIDLRRMAAIGHRVAARVTLAKTGEALAADERLKLLASDMERVDLVALDRALERLPWREAGGEGSAGATASLIVSVSYLTASTQRSRMRFLDRSRPLRDRARASIIWALSDVPEGAPRGRLDEVAAHLKPFGRAVFAATGLGGATQHCARSTTGIMGLVIEPQSALSTDDMALWLLQAGRLAQRTAPALIAAGLASQTLLPMAAVAGFTHATLRQDEVWIGA